MFMQEPEHEWHIFEKIGELLGRPASEIAEMIDKAKAKSLVTQSDPNAPPELVSLALICEAETGQEITAIVPGKYEMFQPAKELRGMPLLEWHQRRIAGKLRGDDSPVSHVKVSGWAFVVKGNPIEVQEWAEDNGFKDAFAFNPWRCFIATTEKETKTLTPEQWNEMKRKV